MEGVGQLFGSLLEIDDSLLDTFLKNLDEHQSFWTDPQNDLDAIFTKIRTLLSGSRTRDRGLKIVIHLLSGCPLDLIEDSAQFYMNLCTKVCDQRGPTQTLPLVYKLLQQLIHRSLASTDLHKMFVSNLPKLLESVGPKLPTAAVPSALAFLEQAMQHYAGACGPMKSRIESFLYSLVDSANPLIVGSTARCLLLLQQIRGGGQHGSLHKRTWEEYYLKLVDTIHDLLNQIFAHTPETFDEEDNLECLKLSPIANTIKNPIRKAQLLAVRAINVITFLDQAIVGAYPVAKPIAPFKAVNLILRGLSVSCEAMGKNPLAENIAFGTFLPSIHYGLLEVLDGLVLALGTNMLMYGDSICEIFPKCLRATQTNRSSDSEGTKKSFTRLRTKLYESIQLWCEKMRYGSNIEMVNEPLLEQIVRDFTPFESEITLKMGASGNKRLSARAKRKLQKEQNAATALNQNHSSRSGISERKEQLIDAGNEPLCQAALDCLSVLLQSAGCFIKPVTHKLLEEKIVPLCFSLVSNHRQLGLYSDDKVRVALLRAYAALIVNPHHHSPPPLQYASYIFNTLQSTDSSAAVRAVAAELARTMELVVHPWKETLHFPADKSAIKDAMANKEKHPLAMLTVMKQSFVAFPEINGKVQQIDAFDAVNSTLAEPQHRSSPKKPANDAAAEQDVTYESEGEINESLAVTEASDDSFVADENQQPKPTESEPTGWVEHVTVSSLEDTMKGKSNEITTIPDAPDCYDAGVIQCSEDDDDDDGANKPEEPAVVSILDSEEEEQVQVQKAADDDVVEVSMDVDLVAPEPKHAKSPLKHTIISQAKDDVTANGGGSPKKAKLSQDNCNGIGKAKNIDDIVNEMVAEFVDEP